jgi:hypothetical protein
MGPFCTALRRFGALAAASLALGGCGGSSRTAQTTAIHTTTVTRTVTTTPATTSGATSTTTTGTATSTTAGGAGACTAADLTPSFLGSNGATGHVVLGFALRNTSHAACHTYGFAGVQFVARNGAVIPIDPERSTQDLLGSAPETRLTLAPGQEASFRIVTSDVASGPGTCPTAASLRIIAPDDTAAMNVAFTPVLDCGRPTVSPLLSGADAVPGV